MIDVKLNICIVHHLLKICNRHKLRDKCCKNIIELSNVVTDDYVKYLSGILREYTNRNLSDRQRDGSVFEYIVLSINDTMHFILEPIIDNKELLFKIGQELFDICCFTFVGGDYLKKIPIEPK